MGNEAASGLLFVIFYVGVVVATGVVAKKKNRLVRSWVAGAIFTNWIALVLVSVLPPVPRPGEEPEVLAARVRDLERRLAEAEGQRASDRG